MKKNLPFVIESLRCGGAEKSLIALLSALDYEQFNVDLMLFSRGGMFEKHLPPQVRIIPQIAILDFLSLGFLSQLKEALWSGKFGYFISRMLFSVVLRLRRNTIVSNARIWWRCFQKHIPCSEQYDIAIAYGQTFPTFYVADKACAKKKFAWVNCMYSPQGKEKKFQKPFYEAVDKIVCVSAESQQLFSKNYSEFAEKTCVVKDITAASQIESWAEAYIPKEVVNVCGGGGGRKHTL